MRIVVYEYMYIYGLCRMQEAIARKVGIVTLPTRREIAADQGISPDNLPMSDPRIQV